MTKHPKISVIVPFYNVEKTLFVNCINSILEQTFEDFELIVVNDGSDEKYNELLDEIIHVDTRIAVYNQENGGVSKARNYGVEISKGEYVAFVDADDIVHKQFLEQAFSIIEKTDVDFVIGSIINMDSAKIDVAKIKSQNLQNTNDYKVYEQFEITDLIPSFIAANRIIRFANGGHVNRGPVARLLKTEIAKKVSFPVGIPIGEDLIWNQYVLKSCNRIAIAENIWYYYLTHNSSAVYRYRENAIDIIRATGIGLYESIGNMSDNQIYRAYCTRILGQTRQTVCMAYLTNKDNKDSFWKKWAIFRSLKKEFPWKYITQRYAKIGDRRERICYFLYWCNVYFLIAYIKDKFHN